MTNPTIQLQGVPFNVLKAPVILARREACRACPHVMMFAWPNDERVYSCEKLHSLFQPSRHPDHYLRLFVERLDVACPDGRWEKATLADVRGPADKPLEGQSIFQMLWAEIHDPQRHWDERFVLSVRMRLPCGDCKEHFDAYVTANPPPLGDDVGCWLWGHSLHNTVRARQGKPPMPLEEFRRLYGQACGGGACGCRR
jgi:hypothetical protein